MTRVAAPALACAALALLAGCASAPPAVDEARKYKPLSAYASDPFVPVNLYLNANEQAAPTIAALIEHAARRLQDSGAFVRVDRGVQRWPLTIQARYAMRTLPAAGARVLSVLTLGLVPQRVPQEHALVAEIFAEPETVAALELSITVHDRVSLYHRGDASAERAAVEALLERFVAEVAQRKLIPRWNTFKPEPEPRRKKKPLGRPT